MPTVISGSGITLPGDAVSPLGAVTRQQILSLMPSGVVLPFATPTVPAGWLKCSGQAVSRTDYADLFSAIGTTYGAGNGTTTFNLPNLQGEFIRGLDETRGVDPGRTLGSSQGGQMPAHTHIGGYGSNSIADFGRYGGVDTGVGATRYSLSSGPESRSPYVSTTGGTANNSENRPRNVALLFCIKT